MEQELLRDKQLVQAYDYLVRLGGFEFSSYDNIKKYLTGVRGVPRTLSKGQELVILYSKLCSRSGTIDIFKHLLTILTPFYTLEDDYTLTVLTQKEHDMLEKLQNLGCFGINRYSMNFETGTIFDEKCPLSIKLEALSYLCELCFMRRAEEEGFFSKRDAYERKALVADLCAQVSRGLFVKPNLFVTELIETTDHARYDLEDGETLDSDLRLRRLEGKLETLKEVDERLETQETPMDAFPQIFLDKEELTLEDIKIIQEKAEANEKVIEEIRGLSVAMEGVKLASGKLSLKRDYPKILEERKLDFSDSSLGNIRLIQQLDKGLDNSSQKVRHSLLQIEKSLTSHSL